MSEASTPAWYEKERTRRATKAAPSSHLRPRCRRTIWKACWPRCKPCRPVISPSRLPGSRTGISGKIADTFNEIVSTNQKMSQQLEQVGEIVGKQGRTRHRVKLGLTKAPGARWKSRSTP